MPVTAAIPGICTSSIYLFRLTLHLEEGPGEQPLRSYERPFSETA